MKPVWVALHVAACIACALNVWLRPDDRMLWVAMLVLFLFDLVQETEKP